MADVILCITEGSRTEPNLLKTIAGHFLDNELEILPVGLNIYDLYSKMSVEDGDFIDTFSVAKQLTTCQIDLNLLHKYQREDIAEIYLFFDYDGHATLANDSVIEKFLTFFNDETGNGKLYISYPMIEAYKDKVGCTQLLTIDVSHGTRYKNICASRCDKKYENFLKLDKNLWNMQLKIHFEVSQIITNNCLIDYMHHEDLLENLSQSNIFFNQKVKYIELLQSVAVLSPLPLFLIEYKGKSIYEGWLSQN